MYDLTDGCAWDDAPPAGGGNGLEDLDESARAEDGRHNGEVQAERGHSQKFMRMEAEDETTMDPRGVELTSVGVASPGDKRCD